LEPLLAPVFEPLALELRAARPAFGSRVLEL
jgi:hypothetical protein